MRPPPEPGRDFQNRTRRQTLANPRKNCAGPLRGRAAPRLRPFLPRLFPIVLHGRTAIIAETHSSKNGWGRNRTADPFQAVFCWSKAVIYLVIRSLTNSALLRHATFMASKYVRKGSPYYWVRFQKPDGTWGGKS